MSDKLLIVYFELMNSEQAVKNCPKMTYFSMTTQSLYIMHSVWNLSPYLNVSVIRGCQIAGHNIEKFELKLESYLGMMKSLEVFNDFLNRHINRKDYSHLLYEWPMSTKLRREEPRRPKIGDKTYSLADGYGFINQFIGEDRLIIRLATETDEEDEGFDIVEIFKSLYWDETEKLWEYGDTDKK